MSVREKISQIASRVIGDNVPEFTDCEILIDSGLLDSPGIIELIIWIEDNFEISVPENEVTFDNLGSVNAITSFIESKTN